jgi:four helix bundle protein
MKTTIMQEKSITFAIQIVNLVKDIQQNQKEIILTKQLLRSGTAIGAMLSESEFAESNADFIHKQSVALKEANETRYWLLILNKTKYLDIDKFNIIFSANYEIIKMLISSINTLKQKNKN